MTEWISIEDRLPELWSLCIVTNGNHVDIALFSDRGWKGHTLLWDFESDGISEESRQSPTHWMPLPAPPEEGK